MVDTDCPPILLRLEDTTAVEIPVGDVGPEAQSRGGRTLWGIDEAMMAAEVAVGDVTSTIVGNEVEQTWGLSSMAFNVGGSSGKLILPTSAGSSFEIFEIPFIRPCSFCEQLVNHDGHFLLHAADL